MLKRFAVSGCYRLTGLEKDVLMGILHWLFAASALALAAVVVAEEAPRPLANSTEKSYDQSRVGDGDPGRIVVPTNQVLSPLGRQVAYSGRPTDLALSPDGRWLAVLDRGQVLTINPVSCQVVARVPHKGGSYAGLVFTPDGKRLLTSSITSTIGVFDVSDSGALSPQPPIKLAAASDGRAESALPISLAIDGSGKTLWAVLNLNNTLAEIDLASGRVKREIVVGNAPYGVVLVRDKAYVTNWAGRKPDGDSLTGPSGRGAPVRVDPRTHIASDGSVSVVDLAAGKEERQIAVGLHPSAVIVTPDGSHVLVANANSDSVSVIETRGNKVVETISTRPAEGLLFGSAPNALAISPDGKTLYVSNGTNNAVMVIALEPGKSRLLGGFPTGWYPAGLALDNARGALYVANVKGVGSRNNEWRGQRKVKNQLVNGYSSHDQLGTVSLVPLPSPG